MPKNKSRILGVERVFSMRKSNQKNRKSTHPPCGGMGGAFRYSEIFCALKYVNLDAYMDAICIFASEIKSQI